MCVFSAELLVCETQAYSCLFNQIYSSAVNIKAPICALHYSGCVLIDMLSADPSFWKHIGHGCIQHYEKPSSVMSNSEKTRNVYSLMSRSTSLTIRCSVKTYFLGSWTKILRNSLPGCIVVISRMHGVRNYWFGW